MRLASFSVQEGEQAAECTIISFPGDVGGIDSNIRRWMGQISLNLPDEGVADFIRAAERLQTSQKFTILFFDFGALLPDDDPDRPSMLACIVRIRDTSVYVKMTGPKSFLQLKRDAFVELNGSIVELEESE